jgi:hypothetical protein
MKQYISILVITLTLASGSSSIAQSGSGKVPVCKISIQAGIGLHPDPTGFKDLAFSGLVQWKLNKQFSIASHTAYIINDLSMRNFNYIKTNYNYAVNQKVGVGTSVSRKKSSHTFLIMGGVKYDAFSQTLDNPEFEKITSRVAVLSPDYGLLYNLKLGNKKYFFGFSMYLPLFPYPLKGNDINFLESNMSNLSLEIGAGIRL